MATSSFWRQFAALMKRNFYLKKRNKNSTIQEYLLPIYFVVLLGIIRMSISPRHEPEVANFPEHSLTTVSYVPTSYFFVTPDTTFTRQIMTNLSDEIPNVITGWTFFDSHDELNEYYKDNSTAHAEYAIGLEFGSEGDTGDVKYTLRFSSASVPSTKSDHMYRSQGLCRQLDGLAACTGNYYILSGFARLQSVLDTLLIRYFSDNQTYPVPELSVQQMPKSSWTSTTTSFQVFSSIYFVIAYSVFVSFMLVAIVTEKEKKIKDGMRLMGLRTSALWLSWGVTYAIIIAKVTVVITLLAWLIKLYHHSNMVYLYLQLFLYGLSIITFSFMLTPFFHKAELAGAVGSIITTLFSLMYLAVVLTRSGQTGPEGPVSAVPPWAQWLLSLCSPIALALGIDQGLYLDISHGGMHTDTLWYGEFPVAASLIMLTVDFVLYGLLAVYLDNVIPDEYGQKNSPLFCFSLSYWCPRPRTDEEMTSLMASIVTVTSPQCAEQGHIEPVVGELLDQNVIRICNIKKSFIAKKKKVVPAVDGMTLDIYKGQITAILGHNGAGKTTLINMLTGMTPPSGGTAFIHNLNVSDSTSHGQIRSMMGVCPQHDILLPDLTCQEHLQLFSAIKNVPKNTVDHVVEFILNDVDLSKEKKTRAGKLSGGQRRKLSLAIALIGDPKILLLDEPTAGLDPFSRRQVWTLLKDRCKDRVVLLTTHFMDEADILADRKAFMSKGRLKCVGTSLFLKNRFGLGYHVGLVVEVGSDQEAITSIIMGHIPQSTLHRASGHELTYTIPLAEVHQFPKLLVAIETAISDGNHGIRTYGVSMTTLEEVFLKIGIEEEADESDEDISVPLLSRHPGYQAMGVAEAVHRDTGHHDNVQMSMVDPEDDLGVDMAAGRALVLQQFGALCKVKMLHLKRNKAALVFRVILPIIFILLGVTMYSLVNPFKNEPGSLALSPSFYVNTSVSPSSPDLVHLASGEAVHQDLEDFLNTVKASDIVTSPMHNVTHLLHVQPHHLGFNIYDVNNHRVTIVYNDSATHSVPIAINILSNAFAAMVTGVTVPTITTSTLPWPDMETTTAAMSSMGAAIILGMAPVGVPASLALLLVRERQNKIRSQLRLSGVSHAMYWGSTFSADIVQLALIAVCAIIIILAFQVPSLVTGGAMLCLVLMYAVYFPLTLILAYVISFAFNKFEAAQHIMFNAFTFAAVIPYIIVSMLDVNQLTTAATALHTVFCCIDPPYVFIGIIYYINKVYIVSVLSHGLDAHIPISEYFRWNNNITIAFIPPVFHIIWLLILLRYLEIRASGGTMTGKLSKSSNRVTGGNAAGLQREDSDVEEERTRVQAIVQEQPTDGNAKSSEKHAVVVQNLSKVFGAKKPICPCSKKTKVKVAVRNTTFCVEEGEVLGLLGPNGAGKTTTMNMITAEEAPSSGNVTIGGQDINSGLSSAYSHLGYCPQQDALYDDITLREHFDLYLSLRGHRPDTRRAIVNYYSQSLQLADHADKPVSKLSGGTKRKLSYGIAMVGRPKIVLLDEPSTGLDPKSKRYLWDTISQTFARSSRGAILTTHYMEEADALCNRVGIMVNGKLVCLGSTQHLKNKYGNGYILEVKLAPSTSAACAQSVEANTETAPQTKHVAVGSVSQAVRPRDEALHKFICELVPGAERVEHFQERATYKISQDAVLSIANIFETIEENKAGLGIEDYSFSQSTLEQVFLEFAKKQREEADLAEEPDQNEDVNVSTQHLAQASAV